MRDGQREKVYQAEFALRDLYDHTVAIGNPRVLLDGICLILPPEAKFASIESVRSYCDRVTQMVGVTPVRVRTRAGEFKAHYEHGGVIALPDTLGSFAMREIVVLHELAHHMAIGERHGPVFVATLTELFSTVMGPEVGLAYRILCGHSGAVEGVRA